MPPRKVAIADLLALVGQELGVSDWFIIDQRRIDNFAEVTEDRQWIHVDVERATRELGAPIAHGFLTLSLLSAMSCQILEVEGVSRAVNYGFDKVRFVNPVSAGARIRLRETLTSIQEKAGGFAVTRACTIEIEGEDKPALVADWVGVLYS